MYIFIYMYVYIYIYIYRYRYIYVGSEVSALQAAIGELAGKNC